MKGTIVVAPCKRGQVRAMLPTNVTAEDIVHDLGVLLAER